MAIAANNTTKIATISATTEAAPQTISSVIDAIVAVAPTEANRVNQSGWIGGTWQIAFATTSDALQFTTNFTCEFRDTAAIQHTARIILETASTLIYARSAGLGIGNLATFQNSNGRLIARRLIGAINPRIVVNCLGASPRSDVFGAASTGQSINYLVEGLDIIFVGSNFGAIKLYAAAGATIQNINVAGTVSLQFFSSSTAEAGCPAFAGLLFAGSALSGDVANEARFVRFVKCVHLGAAAPTANNRATHMIFVDSDWRAGVPTLFGASSGSNYHAGVDIRFTHNLRFVDAAQAAVAAVNVRYKRSDNAISSAISNASGDVPAIELLCRSTPGVAATSKAAGSFDNFAWLIQSRHYSYNFADQVFNGQIFAPISVVQPGTVDRAVTVTEAVAGAITGIAIDPATTKITVSADLTLSDLYHYYRWWISRIANFDTAQFASADSGVVNIGSWTIDIINNGRLRKSANLSTITTTGALTVSGDGDYFVPITAAGTTYYPAVTFSGLPTAPNANGVAPNPVMAIRSGAGPWQAVTVTAGEARFRLTDYGFGPYQVKADAIGYRRTLPISIAANFEGTYLFGLDEFLADDGTPMVGKQPPANALTFDGIAMRFEFTAGNHSFYGIFYDKEILTSTATALVTLDDAQVRGVEFVENTSYRLVTIPSVFKIAANPNATTAPIFTDFSVIRDDGDDPFAHALASANPGLTHRPEVIVNYQGAGRVSEEILNNLLTVPKYLALS